MIGKGAEAYGPFLVSGGEMNDLGLTPGEFLKEIAAAQSPDALEQVRVRLLGRNGAITGAMRGLGSLPQEQRREAGAKLNVLRDEIAAAIEARKKDLGRAVVRRVGTVARPPARSEWGDYGGHARPQVPPAGAASRSRRQAECAAGRDR